MTGPPNPCCDIPDCSYRHTQFGRGFRRWTWTPPQKSKQIMRAPPHLTRPNISQPRALPNSYPLPAWA